MTTADALPAPERSNRAGAWIVALLMAGLVAVLNGVAWRVMHKPTDAPHAEARVAGMAYNAFGRWDSPLAGRMPEVASMVADLDLVSGMTPRLRTYSSSEFPKLPALAQERGLSIAQGVWLDNRTANNASEVNTAIDLANRHPNIKRIIAGNETQLHGTVRPAELYEVLDHLRRRVRVPVSTAEPWHVWLKQPELAKHVDFITVHLLPYWEGVSVDAALDHAFARLRDVQQRFPNKRIVIGEIGWPSGGDNVKDAVASPDNQARFVRGFLARARSEGVSDYYLMEAVDQPWKRQTEGRAGAHWGVLDAARRAKFAYEGPVQRDAFWQSKAWASSGVGFMAAFATLLAWPRLRMRARALLALASQAMGTAAVVLLSLPLLDYFRAFDAPALLLLGPAVVLMSSLMLVHVVEFAEMFWRQHLRGRFHERPWSGRDEDAPFVSVHLACCNEPPAMVIATLDSLLALDWPAFEVIVVDNNTTDDACWRPVQAHVDAWRVANPQLAQRLNFIHLPSWPGYKAGALNVALDRSNPRSEWVAVVDADYIVDRSWLRQLGGWFAFDDVGVVQSPQAHRDWQRRPLARMMNWEYDGFFRIGMHHRHERNAVIQHGTMTIVRAQALRAVRGWNTACVCEDTELGLRLLARKLRVLYVDRVFGTGLVPQDFDAYARQRRRWAMGAMQIMKQHPRTIFGRSSLSLAQRYHFVAGWLPWLGDAMHLVFTLSAIGWSIAMLVAPSMFALPVATFAAPVVAYFVGRALLVPLLYSRNVPCAFIDVVGAAVAGMALSHSVARGVFAGLLRRGGVFEVTRKAGTPSASAPAATSISTANARAVDPVREHRWLLAGLIASGAMLTLVAGGIDRTLGAWLIVLAMQGVPYAMALLCQWLGTRKSTLPVRRWRKPMVITNE